MLHFQQYKIKYIRWGQCFRYREDSFFFFNINHRFRHSLLSVSLSLSLSLNLSLVSSLCKQYQNSIGPTSVSQSVRQSSRYSQILIFEANEFMKVKMSVDVNSLPRALIINNLDFHSKMVGPVKTGGISLQTDCFTH